MQVIAFLRLIRIENLLMIFLTQYLVKYFLFEPFHIDVALNWFGFLLLVLSMVFLAAAGNIINDIYDIETDTINKPEKQVIGRSISENIAFKWFFAFNILGVGIGFYLSNLIGTRGFTALFILPSAFLYLYATQLKRTVLVGNLVVSTMVGMIIIMIGIFDLFPVINSQNRTTQRVLFSVLIDYAIFAFLINLLREMVKDQEDIQGDYNAGMRTLPIVLGRKRTNKVIFAVALLPVAGLLYYIFTYLQENKFAALYALFFILAPLLYFMVKILVVQDKKQYHQLSLLLKLILALGLLSIGLYQFILT